MTVAVDIQTGKVIGQVLETLDTGLTLIFTRYGYKTVQTSLVRIEQA